MFEANRYALKHPTLNQVGFELLVDHGRKDHTAVALVARVDGSSKTEVFDTLNPGEDVRGELAVLLARHGFTDSPHEICRKLFPDAPLFYHGNKMDATCRARPTKGGVFVAADAGQYFDLRKLAEEVRYHGSAHVNIEPGDGTRYSFCLTRHAGSSGVWFCRIDGEARAPGTLLTPRFTLGPSQVVETFGDNPWSQTLLAWWMDQFLALYVHA